MLFLALLAPLPAWAAPPTPTATASPPLAAALARDQLADITSQVTLAPDELVRIGRGAVTALAYSPDGRLLAALTRDGVWMYRTSRVAQDRGARLRLPGPVSDLSWSCPATCKAPRLAVSSGDGKVRVWDPTQGRVVLTIDTAP